MKNLSFYKTTLNCNTEDQVFDFLISNLKPSNTFGHILLIGRKSLPTQSKLSLL